MFYHKGLKPESNHSEESGFILLTVPVILALFGFFITAMLNDTKPNQFYFETATQDKMQDVRVALAAYAHRNYRIPCPGEPDAAPAARGSEGGCATTKGILPFRELGLPESAAKDEWGNYITYKVSPDFTRNFTVGTKDTHFDEVGNGGEQMLVPKGGDHNSLHEMCRTPNWVSNETNYVMSDGNTATMTAQNINQNIYKARFCCPSNLSASSGGTQTAEDNQDRVGGKTLDLGGLNEVIMSIEGLDSNIALWNSYHDQVVADSVAVAASKHFEYNDNLQHDGEHVGKAIGPNRSPAHTGKYYREAAVFDINDSELDIRDFTMEMSDLDVNNHHEPLQISMDVVTSDGTLIDTVALVLQLPAPANGIGELSISLDRMEGNADQDGLFHSGSFDPRGHGDPASEAEDLFNASKASLMNKLNTAGLTLDDVEIGRLKMNSTHASMGFHSIKYGSAGTPDNTDLIVRKEDGAERLTPRNNAASYASASVVYDAPITQDYEAAAYALISHGSDGEGSYLVNGTNNKIDNIPDAQENPSERLNHSDAPVDLREVLDVRKISSDVQNEKFDDVILWDSQITLYNSLRNGTCESSQAL